MTAAIAGPYEHTGAYRPDVTAQAEGTEPQWSDAPSECEPGSDLTGTPLPSLREFAWRLADQIASDGYGTNIGSALGLAAIHVSLEVHDYVPRSGGDVMARYLERRMWRDSHDAWRLLREIRVTQLGGRDALNEFRQERS